MAQDPLIVLADHIDRIATTANVNCRSTMQHFGALLATLIAKGVITLEEFDKANAEMINPIEQEWEQKKRDANEKLRREIEGDDGSTTGI